MKKNIRLLLVDSSLNMLSTGRITESIGKLAIAKGWDCYIVHGPRAVNKPSCMNSIQACRKFGVYLHFIESFLFDRHGLASRLSTKKIIKEIKEIKPDIVHLHCIHGYYINYEILFEYLNSIKIPIVWTFHDCWAFTGHCSHFETARCEKWKKECNNCPLKKDYPRSIIDGSKRNYILKKKLFGSNRNLHIVTVSGWLAELAKQSFLKDKDIRVINNGVDVEMFRPCAEKISGKFKIIDVASAWGKGKGLYDFYRIREILPEDEYEIILVGLSEQQIKDLPKGIKGISRTNSVEELAKLYSEANVFVNPTYADSFPTVNMEALACGTPVITYRTGGSPEIIDEGTGVVVEQGDINGIVAAAQKLKSLSNQEIMCMSENCRRRALDKYDKDKRFADYIKLYEELI